MGATVKGSLPLFLCTAIATINAEPAEPAELPDRSILGLRRRGATFVIDPCIPLSRPEYRIAWQFLHTRYEITVSNATRRCRGIVQATLDGAPVDAGAIPPQNDGRTHDVQIVLGDRPHRQPDVQPLTVVSERL